VVEPRHRLSTEKCPVTSPLRSIQFVGTPRNAQIVRPQQYLCDLGYNYTRKAGAKIQRCNSWWRLKEIRNKRRVSVIMSGPFKAVLLSTNALYPSCSVDMQEDRTKKPLVSQRQSSLDISNRIPVDDVILWVWIAAGRSRSQNASLTRPVGMHQTLRPAMLMNS
jgi:hypothetical protein